MGGSLDTVNRKLRLIAATGQCALPLATETSGISSCGSNSCGQVVNKA